MADEQHAAVPSPHSCWVCASRESGHVAEPGFVTRSRVAAEDADVLGHVTMFMRVLGHVARGLNVLAAVTLLLLAYAAATVDAQRTSSANSAASALSSGAVAAAAAFTLAATLVGNTLLGSKAAESKNKHHAALVAAQVDDVTPADRRHLAELLSRAIQIKTISYDKKNLDGHEMDTAEFLKFHAFLRDSFPRVHAADSPVSRTVVNGLSLLYEWPGTDASLAPVMLCAHFDVVPTPNASQWTKEPFSGAIDEAGTIWGRGAIDNKHNVVALMRAVELLLGEDGQARPKRTVFMALGHDEEIGGQDGASHIAAEMQKRLRGAPLAMILDEGPFLIENLLPGVKKPIGLIGNVEKGNVSVKITAKGVPPGHSSMPGAGASNLGILASAIKRLEARPMPAKGFDAFIENLLSLGGELPFALRMVLSNAWLFKPLLKRVVLSKNAMAAGVRTTTAVTMARAGTKINVVPGEASAWVNHRVHPCDEHVDNVVAYDRAVIADPRVTVEVHDDGGFGPIPPSPVSRTDTAQYDLLRATVGQVYDAPVMPTIMIGNTDTRHYWELFGGQAHVQIFRFSPVIFHDIADTKMFHGIDERVSTENLVLLQQFYAELLKNLDLVQLNN